MFLALEQNSAKTRIESDVFAGGHVRYGSPRPPPRPSDRRTRLNAPAGRAKHSNSVPLFAPACALRPRQGPLCALFMLCPGVRRRRRSFRGVGRSQASARFFGCRPLHLVDTGFPASLPILERGPHIAQTLSKTRSLLSASTAYFARSSRASRITFSFTSAKALAWICRTVRLRLKLKDWPATACSICSMT